MTAKAVRFALTLSPDVVAMHLTQLSGPDADEEDHLLRARWRADVEKPVEALGRAAPRLVTMQARYRDMHEPVLKQIEVLRATFGKRRVAVLVPQIVRQRWYQYLLHAQRARRFRTQLLRFGGPELTVVSIPWYLDKVEVDPDAS